MSTFNSVQFNRALFGGGSAVVPCGVEVGKGILYPALRKAGITLGPQRTPSDAQYEDAIDELNRLISSLSCDRLFIYSLTEYTFPLTDGKTSYTIGVPCDPNTVVDFAVPRPLAIAQANLTWDSGGCSHLRVTSEPQCADSCGGGGTLYNDRAVPVSTLRLPGPAPAGVSLQIFVWQTTPRVSAPSDVIDMPEGYEDALVLNLALRLAPQFQRRIDPTLRLDARESLMRIQSINAPQPVASLDAWGSCCADSGSMVVSGGGSGNGGGNGNGSGGVGPVGPQGPPGPAGPAGPAGVYDIQDEGILFPRRAILNFAGTGVTVTDDPANNRSIIDVPGSEGFLIDPMTAVGDMIVRGPSQPSRLPIGATDGWVLTVDSAQTLKMKWAAASGGGGAVASFNSRTGAVVPVAGDYPPAFIGAAAVSHVHAAADVTSGVMAVARLGTGTPTASTYLKGDGAWTVPAFAPTSHTHAAADTTSGVFAVARLGTGTPSASNYLRGDGAWTAAPADLVSSVHGRTGAVVAVATDYTPAFIGAALAVHVHSGADITTGTVAAARLGSGTPSASNFLRGDGSWQVPAGGGSQTPWTSDIDAAGFMLQNVGLGLFGDLLVFGSLEVGQCNIGSDPRTATITVPTDGAADSGAFVISTRNLGTLAERVRVSAAGNVGIGKSPGYKLDVNGDINSSGNVSALNHFGDFYGNIFEVHNVFTIATAAGAGGVIYQTSGAWKWMIRKIGAEPGSNSGADLQFTCFADAGGELFNHITLKRSTGRVGIRVDSPAYTLDVGGDVNASGSVIRLPGLPSTAPAGGSKQLWYDPADSNRVKYVP